MIKTNVKINNEIKFSAKHSNLVEAQNWFYSERAAGTFGKLGGWYNEDQLTEEEKASAIEIAENTFEGKTIKLYKLEDSFGVEFLDITQELELKSKLEKASKKRRFGQEILEYLNYLNNEKIDSGVWSSETTALAISNSTLGLIERLLNFGSLEEPKKILQASDISAFYTSQEKQTIIDMIDERIEQL